MPPRRFLPGPGAMFPAFLLAFALAQAGPAEHEELAREFFDSTNLITFKVELGEAEISQLAQRPKSYVCGRVRVGDQVWENVGIRLKGSGTFQPIDQHPSFALKFNWKESHQ